ncbi:MAG: radical SAM protein [Bacteroidota bacterium]
MKILLINPPRSSENKILEFAPEKAKPFIHKKLIGPPLGLLTVAAAVKDFDVFVYDLKGEYDLNPEAPALENIVLHLLKEYQPDVVGTTLITSEFYSGITIFKTVKKHNPEILTVAGGLHATLCPQDFSYPCFDIICPGQSAHTFREVILAKINDQAFSTVGGILINTPEGIVKSANPAPGRNAADRDFLMPDRTHLRKWINTYKVGNSPFPSTYLFTSLGCPHQCSFCSIWPSFNGCFYQRNTESVIEELKMTGDYPVVRFADANTIVETHFINRLFDRIKEEGIRKDFVMDIRFDTAVMHSGLIEKLARNGLKVVICGFESFREKELLKYKKGASAKLIEEAINIFHQNGIMLRGNYVIPNNYDEQDFEALADYAHAHQVVYAGYTILSPMPGTAFYKDVKNQIIDHDLSKYNFFNSVMKTKLPVEKFYETIGRLWLIKKGTDVI